MSEIQLRALNAIAKLPSDLQEKAVIRLEATADAVEQVSKAIAHDDHNQ